MPYFRHVWAIQTYLTINWWYCKAKVQKVKQHCSSLSASNTEPHGHLQVGTMNRQHTAVKQRKHFLLPVKGSVKTQRWGVAACKVGEAPHRASGLPGSETAGRCRWPLHHGGGVSGSSHLCPRRAAGAVSGAQFCGKESEGKHGARLFLAAAGGNTSLPLYHFLSAQTYMRSCSPSLSLSCLCLRWFPRAKYFWTIFIIFIQLKPPRLYEM